MAIFTRSFLKVFLVSTCVLSVAMAIKICVPVILQFVVFQLPLIYNFFISYLKPPYLYLVINCIIITIVASSKLQNKLDESSAPVSDKITSVLTMEVKLAEAVEVRRKDEYYGDEENAAKVIESLVPEAGYIDLSATIMEAETAKVMEESKINNDVDEVVVSRSCLTPPVRQDSMELLSSSEKPLVSARFGRRKAVKASSEVGKTLRVTKPKRQDTLESTWKTITEGRSMPLARHLKKSDTCEARYHNTNTVQMEKTMIKSETFHCQSSSLQRAGSGKLKKEPSLGQDELNRRVESFIKKFNEDMKLQRQESLNHYQEMIKRGV